MKPFLNFISFFHLGRTPGRLGSFFFTVAIALCLNAAVVHADPDFTPDTARQAATNSGDPKALYFLARSYAKGNGVVRNPAEAASYMRQAAEKGYAFAQNDLGSYYARGFGVKENYEEAAKWYRKAADNGDSLAQYTMGMICFKGRGVPKDIPQGVAWYQKSAEQGQPDSMLALGGIYLDGSDGVPVDTQEALKWFRKAEALGRPEAMNSIGFIYEHGGIGIKQDSAEAVAHYRQAAEKKLGKALTNLGRMYQTGTGVQKDLLEAYKWFVLGAQNGDGVANHYQLELEGDNPTGKPLISPEQIATARRMAHDWSKTHQEQQQAEK